MIHSFRGRATKLVWEGRYSPSLPTDAQSTALRKLRLLNEAGGIAELAAIPGMGRLLAARVGDGLLAALHARPQLS